MVVVFQFASTRGCFSSGVLLLFCAAIALASSPVVGVERWSVAPSTISVGFCIFGEVVGGDEDGRVGCLKAEFVSRFLWTGCLWL